MMNYRNVLNDAKLILKKSSILTAELDAEILLSISLKEKREKILLNLENRISSEQLCNFYKLVDIRKKKVPISIIAGKKSFWKSDFIVNRDVLTPRFETELLVEKVLKINNKSTKINVLDIGIGSGCILISLLQDRKNWRGTGIDPSKEAIKIAKINAKIQQVYDRIHFINSNIDNFIGGKYDLIVSNPPYINKIGYSNLDKSVKEYEPRMALRCGGTSRGAPRGGRRAGPRPARRGGRRWRGPWPPWRAGDRGGRRRAAPPRCRPRCRAR